MANIDKQMVARMPVREFAEFTLDYRNDWCIPIKKIWAKKEIDRFTFKLSDNEGLLECSPKLAQELSRTVGTTLKSACIDTSKVDSVKIIIAKNKENVSGYCIGVYTDELPKRNAFARAWSSIKGVFK
ncbi:MAG: hypothetical protein WC516_04610 [Patescibacteria group bacterium]|jgi:hypothetical protein